MCLCYSPVCADNISGSKRRIRPRPVSQVGRRGRSIAPDGSGGARPGSPDRRNTGSRDGHVDPAASSPSSTTRAPGVDARLTTEVRGARGGGGGRLEVFIAWDWAPTGSRSRQPALMQFEVHVLRETCNVDASLPHCDVIYTYRPITVWSAQPNVSDDRRRFSPLFDIIYWELSGSMLQKIVHIVQQLISGVIYAALPKCS